jgi:hypothetical protein
MKSPTSFRRRVLQTVLSREETTIGQVIAAVGRHIDAVSAVRAIQRVFRYGGQRGKFNVTNPIYTAEHLAYLGRKELIRVCLSRLAREGKIRRIGRGVYGPPLPKLHHESGMAS